MNAQITLRQLLAAVGHLYRSINVRTVAGQVDETLYSLATVVEFSTWAQDVCARNWQHRFESHDPLGPGPLHVYQACYSIAEWPRIVNALSSKTVQFGDVTVRITDGIVPDDLKGCLEAYGNFIERRTPWPMFEATQICGSREEIAPGRDLNSALSSLPYEAALQMGQSGFPGYRDVVAHYLRYRKDTDPPMPSVVHVVAPIPVAVHEVSIDPEHQTARAHILVPAALATSIRLRGEITGRASHRTALHFGSIQHESNALHPDMAYADAECDVSPLQESVVVRVIHNQLGILAVSGYRVRDVQPRTYVNPVFEILQRFCSQDELISLLTKPQSLPDRETKPQRLFEQHVQWLLSCYGFVAIALGPKEYLYDVDEPTGNKMRRGSLDLFAFHPQRRLLLLVSCKMNVPREDDYANLINLRASFALQLAGSDIRGALAVFTAAAECLPNARYGEGQHHIAVFDQPAIQDLVAALAERNEEQLFEALAGRIEWFPMH